MIVCVFVGESYTQQYSSHMAEACKPVTDMLSNNPCSDNQVTESDPLGCLKSLSFPYSPNASVV